MNLKINTIKSYMEDKFLMFSKIKSMCMNIAAAFAVVAAVSLLVGIYMGGAVVHAANGPNKAATSAAYVQVGNRTDGYKMLYSYAGESKVVTVEGAVYDAATNTLTLTNFNKPEYIISANEMGDDFKIVVVGENHVQQITVWGFGYGGSLEIDGDGKLIVNENLRYENDAIKVLAEASASRLTIKQTVSLSVYLSKSDIIMGVYDSTLESDAFVLESAAAAKKYKVDIKKNQTNKIVEAYTTTLLRQYNIVNNANDPNNRYGLVKYTQNTGGMLYEVYKMVDVPGIGTAAMLDVALSGDTLKEGLTCLTDGVDDNVILNNMDRYYYTAIDMTSFNKAEYQMFEKNGAQYGCDQYTTFVDGVSTVVTYNMCEIKDYPEYGFSLAVPVPGEQNLSEMPQGYTAVNGNIYYNATIKAATLVIEGTPVSDNVAVDEVKTLEIGTVFKDKGTSAKYKVTGAGTVQYVSPSSKKIKSAVIPKSVTGSDGVKYKVTSIAKKAFYGYKKLTDITVKTTKLTSNGIASKAFKGVKKNVTIKVPKSKKKTYTKIFYKKGLNRKVKIV